MSQPFRAFRLRPSDSRPSVYTEELPKIDRKRATAVLVRQSKTGADTAQAESRETQLGLQDYGRLLYGDEEPNVRLYDEGAGVSGQKRIDQRNELDRLFQDVAKYDERIMGPAHVENVVSLACRTALTYRGVAHVTIPVDVQSEPVGSHVEVSAYVRGSGFAPSNCCRPLSHRSLLRTLRQLH